MVRPYLKRHGLCRPPVTSLSSALLLAIVFCDHAEPRITIPYQFVANSANTFSKKLLPELNLVTQYDKIQSAFDELYNSGALGISPVMGVAETSEFASKLENLFAQKSDALRRVKDRAEKVYEEYTEDEDIEPFTYYNIRTVDSVMNDSVDIYQTFSEAVKVNMTRSFVQVPTNIYSLDKEILNVAKWTENLDDTFKENFNLSQGGIFLQYFGHNSGLFRTYPGNKNGFDENKPDLYDCRRRPWYIQASASPKDIVIVIDVSGSMVGSNIGIAKIAVMSIIDTLQENDFFNVITVSKKATYVIDCLTGLVQATRKNKDAFKRNVQQLPAPNDVLDIENGMETAFQTIYSSTSNLTSANCNRVIMFISDSVEGDYGAEAVFEKWNHNQSVRVFTYLVGRVKNPSMKAMQAMSCNNRGYFYRIETLGNVWDTVLAYLEVISRPLALSGYRRPTYTNLYLDSSGAGMMMTISLAVFSNKNADQKLLGIVGTDLPVRMLREKVPMPKLGVFGHPIVINNNGFVLLHPRVSKQEGYLPTPPNVLLNELEYGTNPKDPIDLKDAMIRRETGSRRFEVNVVYSGNKRITQTNMTFFYQPLRDTPFTAALAFEDVDLYVTAVTEEAFQRSLHEAIAALIVPQVNNSGNTTSKNFTVASIANWIYCDIPAKEQATQPVTQKAYPTADELATYLNKMKRVTEACDKQLISHLVVSAATINNITKVLWNGAGINSTTFDAVFVGTAAGFSRFLSFLNVTDFDRNIFSEDFYAHAYALYKIKSMKAVFSILPEDITIGTDNPTYVTISTPITVGEADNKFLEAVTGARILSTYLDKILLDSSNCRDRDESCEEVNCKLSKVFGCYAIDENGYIASSNQGAKYIGIHFSFYHGRLMEYFANVNVSYYKKIEVYDTQAECPLEDQNTSSANILLSPFKLVAQFLKLSFHFLILLMSQIQFYITWFQQAYVQGKSKADQIFTESCTKLSTFYLLQRHKVAQPLQGSIQCTKTCKQHFAISLIPETNLLFVMVELQPCVGDCNKAQINLAPVKVPGPSLCNQKAEYREPPISCYNYNKTEITVCGSGHMNRPILITLSLLCMISILVLSVW